MVDITRTGYSRVFLLEQRANPDNAPQYEGVWKAGALKWDQGNITVVRVPADGQYDAFTPVGKIIGAPGNPDIDLTAIYSATELSKMFQLARRGCDNDVQIHIGNCQDPKDFNGGWTKILALEAARPSSYSTEALGALDPSERSLIHETIPLTAEDAYEITRINFGRFADVPLTREAMSVAIIDAINCGECGLPSDGVSKVFTLENYAAGSPGVNAQIVATGDGGKTFVESTIDTLGAAQGANRIIGSGVYLVVISPSTGGSGSIHYSLLSDILRGGLPGQWTQVLTGFVATKGPRAGHSLGSTLNWFVGEGGYVYFTTDITSGVLVQDAGGNTQSNLNSIHGVDSQTLVAVGDNNAVLVTYNGGNTWTAITGPAVGVNLNTVFLRTNLEWWVGAANGRLYYTRDGGVTWREKLFPGAGSGQVRSVRFSSRQVGYMAFDGASGGGKILRTISAGNSWYVAPEGTGVIPVNVRINQLAVTKDNVNVVWGAGLATGGLDGILVKGA